MANRSAPKNKSRNGSLHRALPDRNILLSAALLFLTFEPLDLWPLAGIALVPWFFFLVRAKSAREALTQSLYLCFLFSVVTFAWVAYVVHQFGALPWPLAVIALFLFGLVAQPQFYLAALPLQYLLRKITDAKPNAFVVFGLGLTVALFYAGFDWTLPKLFVDTLGHALFMPRN